MLAEKNKQNFYDLLTIKKHISELDEKMAENDLKKAAGVNDVGQAYQKIDGEVKKLTSTLDPLLAKQHHLLELSEMWKHADENQFGSSGVLMEMKTKFNEMLSEEQIKDQLESNKKQIEATKKLLEEKSKLTDAYDKAGIDKVALEIDHVRFSQEEQAKILAAGLKDRAERIMENNNLVLSGERATLEQRIAAMRSNLVEQKAIIEAEKNEKLSDPSLTPAARSLIVQEAGQAEYKATLQSKEAERKLVLEYYKRNRDAAAEIQKLEIEDQIKANDLLLQNDKLHFDERFALISDSYLKRRVLAGAQMMKDLDNENLTAEERKAIIAKYDSDILALTVEFHKNQEEERKRAHEKEMQEAIAAGDQRKANILKAQADADIALNNKIGNGAGAELERKKKDQAFEYNKQILQNQIQTDFLLVNSTKEGTKERADAEQKLAEDRMHLSDLVKNKSIADEKERRDMIKKYSEEAAGIAISAVDGQFQHEINRIQDRINENTKLYDKEKTDVANSTLNAQQKAAQLIVINEQQKAREDKLNQQKKNEELKKAKFDRDAEILKIVGNTLVSASEWGFFSPQAIAIEAAGAAAVVELLAKPLPHFAHGTGNAPRGLGIWGEAGQEAKIDRQGNIEISPNRATPVMLQGGERIIPHDELNEFLYNNMLQATATMIIPSRQDESAKEIRRLQGIIQEQGDRADRAARNKVVPRVTIKINPGWDAYIRKSVKE